MSQLRSYPLILDNGEPAELLATSRFLDDREDRLIRLRDGREILVPRSEIDTLPDGTYRLRRPLKYFDEPRGERPIDPTPRTRVQKHVDTREQHFEESLRSTEYDVERVPVDRIIPEPLEPRYEGDTLILPVFEEVLVVEKRLVLREEVRITRRTREHVDRQSVPVRRERIEVERVP